LFARPAPAASSRQALQSQLCPTHSEQLPTDPSRSSRDDYLCNAGFSRAADTCLLCPAGSFLSSPGQQCTQCQAGYYYPEDKPSFTFDVCLNCIANSRSVAGAYGVSSCECSLGFLRSEPECQEYDAGYYCETQNSSIVCPMYSTSPTGTGRWCVCITGYVLNTTCTACQICRINLYSSGGELVIDCKPTQTRTPRSWCQ